MATMKKRTTGTRKRTRSTGTSMAKKAGATRRAPKSSTTKRRSRTTAHKKVERGGSSTFARRGGEAPQTAHERKQGTLRSGSGKKVTSRKQAIAIGMNKAREAGAKMRRP